MRRLYVTDLHEPNKGEFERILNDWYDTFYLDALLKRNDLNTQKHGVCTFNLLYFNSKFKLIERKF